VDLLELEDAKSWISRLKGMNEKARDELRSKDSVLWDRKIELCHRIYRDWQYDFSDRAFRGTEENPEKVRGKMAHPFVEGFVGFHPLPIRELERYVALSGGLTMDRERMALARGRIQSLIEQVSRTMDVSRISDADEEADLKLDGDAAVDFERRRREALETARRLKEEGVPF